MDMLYTCNRTLVSVAGFRFKLNYAVALTDQDLIVFKATNTDCYIGCQTCYPGRPNNCSLCKPGYTFTAASTTFCLACDPLCATCNDQGPTNCKTCPVYYEIMIGPVGPCTKKPCHADCKTCQYAFISSDCLTCWDNYNLASAPGPSSCKPNSIESSCISSLMGYNPSSNTCLACHQLSDFLTNQIFCTTSASV